MAKFLSKDSDFGYYFSLYDDEDTLLGTSRVFAKPEQRDAAIASMQNYEAVNSSSVSFEQESDSRFPRYDIIQRKVGEFLFRYRDEDGLQIICGDPCDSVEACRATMKAVIASAPTAVIEK